jgi:hypothetical protein
MKYQIEGIFKRMIKTKKAISFPTLMILFLFILCVVAFLNLNQNLNSSLEKYDFGAMVVEVDSKMNNFPSLNFFTKELLFNIIEESKSDFLKGNIDNSCIDSNKVYWYDARLIENTNELNCLPEFTLEIENEFSDFLKDNIKKNMEKFSISEIESIIDVKLDEEKNILNIYVENTYFGGKDLGKLEYKDTLSKEIELSLYFQLVSSLKNIIPNLPNILETQVPICLKDSQNNGENSEINCIKKIINNHIQLNIGEDIKDSFDLNIKFEDMIEESSNEDYYSLNFLFSHKESKDKLLEFNMILEDNIPYYLINFDVSNSDLIDDVINLRIFQPEFSNNGITNYVILYSYKDFFSRDGNPNYEKLIFLLAENNIPNEFNDNGYLSDGIKYYNSKKSDNLDLTLMVIPAKVDLKEITLEDGSKRLVKDVNIFQIFNHQVGDEGSYEVLENREVNFYVFAVDKLYNYYVAEEDKLETKKIVPNRARGPIPLTIRDRESSNENLYLISDLDDTSSSIGINLKNYNDNNFNNYDIYIFSGREENQILNKECLNADFNCYYYNGLDLIEPNQNILITGDETLSQTLTSNYNKIISTNDFSNSLELKPDFEYEILIVPVDSNGRGILTSSALNSEVIKSPTGDIVIIDNQRQLNPVFKKFEIKNNEYPNLLDSYQINGLILDGNSPTFQWNQKLNLPLSSFTINRYSLHTQAEEEFDIDSLISKKITISLSDGDAGNQLSIS